MGFRRAPSQLAEWVGDYALIEITTDVNGVYQDLHDGVAFGGLQIPLGDDVSGIDC